jgi:Spy/CpxP family protein refolding chaperone
MKKTLLLCCVCLLALPWFAWSQGQGQGGSIELTPWWDRPIVRDLGLSEGQLSQVRVIVRDSRDHLIQLRAAVRSAEGALADEMSEDKVDANRAEAAIDKVVSARGELMRAVSQMSLKLRQILTYSQWQELRKRGAERILSSGGRRQRSGLRQQLR